MPAATTTSADRLPRGAAVAVRFADPTELGIAEPGTVGSGGSAPGRRVSDVVALSGRVQHVSQDTLWVALTSLTTLAGREALPRRPEAVTYVVQSSNASVEVLSASPGMVHGIAGGAVLALVGSMLALLVYCSTTRCMD